MKKATQLFGRHFSKLNTQSKEVTMSDFDKNILSAIKEIRPQDIAKTYNNYYSWVNLETKKHLEKNDFSQALKIYEERLKPLSKISEKDVNNKHFSFNEMPEFKKAVVSYADTVTQIGFTKNYDNALNLLQKAEKIWPQDKEIQQRINNINLELEATRVLTK
jgi:tetratricopeptide (TPR) repeat protein